LVEIEQAGQQVLSRCYLHDIIEYIFFVLIAMPCVQQYFDLKAEPHPTQDSDSLTRGSPAPLSHSEAYFRFGLGTSGPNGTQASARSDYFFPRLQKGRMQKGLLNYFQPKTPAGPGPAASSVSAMLKGV